MDIKIGDWVFYEFKIGQVTKDFESGCTEFSDGSFTTSGRLRDEMFPLTLAGKSCSDWFEYYSQELHRKDTPSKLNWPGIHRHIVGLWVETMEAIGDKKKSEAAFEKAQKFFLSTEDALRVVKEQTTADGIRLFR